MVSIVNYHAYLCNVKRTSELQARVQKLFILLRLLSVLERFDEPQPIGLITLRRFSKFVRTVLKIVQTAIVVETSRLTL
jgi:hypothetical protein